MNHRIQATACGLLIGLGGPLTSRAVAQNLELVVSPQDINKLHVRVEKETVSMSPQTCILLLGTQRLDPPIATVAGHLYLGGTILPYTMPNLPAWTTVPPITWVTKEFQLAPPPPALVGTTVWLQALIGKSLLTSPANWTFGTPDLSEGNPREIRPNGPLGSTFGGVGVLQSCDLNGDAIPDLAFYKVLVGPLQGQGLVVVALGPDFSQQIEFSSPNPVVNANFGGAFHLADLDGDGDDDLIASEFPNPVDGFAHLYVFAGGPNPSPVPTTTFHSTFLGYPGYYGSLATGDLDGDGALELVAGRPRAYVGTTSEAGRVDVFRGLRLQPIATIPHPVPGEQERFGEQVAIADVNGDGHPDLVESSTVADVNGLQNAGRAHVFYGPTLSLAGTIDAPVPTSLGRFGAPVAFLDLDGAGGKEILISNLLGTSAWIYSGSTLGLLRTITPPHLAKVSEALFLGFEIETVDFNSDGFQDIVLGSPRAVNSWDACTANVYDGMFLIAYGPYYRTFRSIFDPQGECSAQFGSAFAVEDFDGDGDPDLAVGVSTSKQAGQSVGRIELLFDR